MKRRKQKYPKPKGKKIMVLAGGDLLGPTMPGWTFRQRGNKVELIDPNGKVDMVYFGKVV